MKRVFQLVAVSGLAFVWNSASAVSLDQIRFIKIAAKESRAVIRGADGKLVVIKPGDVIADAVTVKEIATGRIVLGEQTEHGAETVLVTFINDQPKVQRLRKQPEKMVPVFTPTKPVD